MSRKKQAPGTGRWCALNPSTAEVVKGFRTREAARTYARNNCPLGRTPYTSSSIWRIN